MGASWDSCLNVRAQTGTYVFVSSLTMFSYSWATPITTLTTNINYAVSSVSSYIYGTAPASPSNRSDEESKSNPGPVAQHSSERQNLRIPSDRDHTNSYNGLVHDTFNSMDMVSLSVTSSREPTPEYLPLTDLDDDDVNETTPLKHPNGQNEERHYSDDQRTDFVPTDPMPPPSLARIESPPPANNLSHSGSISPVHRRPKDGTVSPVYKRPKDDKSVIRRSNITKQSEESMLTMLSIQRLIFLYKNDYVNLVQFCYF